MKPVFKTWEDSIEDLQEPKNLLGGKAYGVFSMTAAGLPVPPALTITTEQCNKYLGAGKNGQPLYQWEALIDEVMAGLKELEAQFGYMPLLSVRSGARVSMPGMMDTVLNVGLTNETLQTWVGKIGEWAAMDSYRRLLQMYGSVVYGIEHHRFESILKVVKDQTGTKEDVDMTAEDLSVVANMYLQEIKAQTGHDFPDTLREQVSEAVKAVFNSWNNERAKTYRRLNGYSDDWGTSATVQAMVFGNLNDQSCSGVLFTRDPSTGEDEVVGEYLPNAQGEDVVAGIRTPFPLSDMQNWNHKVLSQLTELVSKLEETYRDMQDVEFTVQDGKLYILQTRSGKRTARAAFKIAHDMWMEALITKEEAFSRVSAKMLSVLTKPTIDPSFKEAPTVVGIAAGGGVVVGKAVFSSDEAVNHTGDCILIAKETTPDDIEGMNASVGIWTATGGLTSHAAVVARGMDKSCVVGCTYLEVHGQMGASLLLEDDMSIKIKPGDLITLDGTTGRVWVGVKVPVIKGELTEEAAALIKIALDEDKPLLRGETELAVGSTVYLDTMVYESGSELNTKALYEDLDNLIGQGLNMVVDFGGRYVDHMSKSDAQVEWLFEEPPNPGMMLDKKIKAFANYAPIKNMQAVMPIWVAEEYVLKVKAMGLPVVPQVNSLKDLMGSEGYCKPSPGLFQSVFGDVDTFHKFLGFMKAGGQEVKVMPTPMTKNEYLYKKFAKGA